MLLYTKASLFKEDNVKGAAIFAEQSEVKIANGALAE